jgi:predicted alternative tryptophan synthase beta-subunit
MKLICPRVPQRWVDFPPSGTVGYIGSLDRPNNARSVHEITRRETVGWPGGNGESASSAFKAPCAFSRSEGIVLGFDPTHAIRTVLDEAEEAK